MQDKERLVGYYMLPIANVDVTPKPNKTYWHWCDVDGKQQEGVPKNKRGVWKYFVDVKHGTGPLQTFKTDPTEKAWDLLFQTAIKNGYKETGELYADVCRFYIDDDEVEITCKQLLDVNDKYYPELTISCKGKEKQFKLMLNLSTRDLCNLTTMLSEIVSKINK